MIKKRKLLICTAFATVLFIGTINYLVTILILAETEPNSPVSTIEQNIYQQFRKLPEIYRTKHNVELPVDVFIKNLASKESSTSLQETWKFARSWVTPNHVVDISSPHIGSVLQAMKETRIVKADIDPRGTQLKLLLTLEGNQQVVFKPKWYEIEKVIEGPVYAGKDRYGAEIIAFFLSLILEMPFTPCSVERTISFTHDVLPVASRLLRNTSYNFGNRTCIYGKCFYCRKEDPICEDPNMSLPGAVIFNVDGQIKHFRSPWQRTYKKNKKALWEESDEYCKRVREKITKKRLLDLIDTSLFDFLMQNGDRHHYETLHDNILLLDNGKGFGNPYVQHLDILAPLYQCCLIRKETIRKLMRLTGGMLKKKLKSIPNARNLITNDHFEALDERLLLIFSTLEYCRSKKLLNVVP